MAVASVAVAAVWLLCRSGQVLTGRLCHAALFQVSRALDLSPGVYFGIEFYFAYDNSKIIEGKATI